MSEYKEQNGTTRVGDFLRGLGDVGKPILEAAAGLTGQGWLSTVANSITTSKDIEEGQKQQVLSLLQLDLQDVENAREHDIKIQESENASWLAKNVGYLIDITLILLLIGIVLGLFTIEIPESNESTLYMVLGLTIGYIGAVVTFHRGSSKGEQDNANKLISKLKK